MADKGSMTDKKAALPGLPPPEEEEEGEVIEFGFSSAVAEHRDDRDREPEDRFQTHSASDNEDEGKFKKKHLLPVQTPH